MRRCVVGCGGVLCQTRVLRMRFDQYDEAACQEQTPRPVGVTYRALPESMLPQQVASDFTPFPLPKYDPELGFGPVRLRDVPDIEHATQRLAQHGSTPTTSTTTTQTTYADEWQERLMQDMLQPHDAATSITAEAAPTAEDKVAETTAPLSPAQSDEDALQGYVVSSDFPYIDRLECRRSPQELLAQFAQRPEREARTATILDLASILPRCSDEEMRAVLDELSSLFTPDGCGLNFLVAAVVKYGRPYAVVSELTKAYVHLVEALTETLVVAQPQRLRAAPALFVQLLHFLALLKVFSPNVWYTRKASQGTNRADYSHPRGINRHTSHQGVAEQLVDFMTDLVREADEGDGRRETLLDACDMTQLVDLLAGFAGLSTEGVAAGVVTRAVLRMMLRRWGTQGNVVHDRALLERLYLVLRLQDVSHDGILHALLDSDEALAAAPTQPPLLHLAPSQCACRGPDFFAAVSRDKRAAVQARACQLLRDSVAAASAAGDEALLQALYESGTELLMTLDDTTMAAREACAMGFDAGVLRGMPGLSTVAARLPPSEAALTIPTRDVQSTLYESVQGAIDPLDDREIALDAKTQPIRTFLPSLADLNGRDTVFLLHSTTLAKSVDELIAVVRRMTSGKEALVVSTQCLRAMTSRAHYAASEQERAVARRGLDIVAYELEQGRAVLVPVSHELRIHDGGTYCDEDLMLWTLAAYFARELPLVKVFAMLSNDSPARYPYHHLKGMHSPVRNSGDLYNKDVPLLRALNSKELRAVTHFVTLPWRVRDAPCKLYNVKPNRARLIYRRDKALFDKYHVTARHLAPGFSQGALASDLRGLGFYTPDHPQVPYKPLPSLVNH